MWSGCTVTGTFQTGTFQTGTFQTGTFQTGTFQTGTFQTGTFQKGTFQTGTFQTGTFQTGTFQTGTFQTHGCRMSSWAKFLLSFSCVIPQESWLQKPEMLNVVSYMTMTSSKDFSLYFAIISRLWLLAANVEW